MKFQETKLKGCYLIDLDKNEDARGSLNRIFCQKTLSPLLKNRSIRQINRTFTKKEGTVRGLHFQNPPFAEIKIVSCTKGEVWDVAVDLRKGSSTFLHYYAVNLNENNPQCFFIPEGFAHGFQALEDENYVVYSCTNYRDKNSEISININDKRLKINWPLRKKIISTKDKKAISFTEYLKQIK